MNGFIAVALALLMASFVATALLAAVAVPLAGLLGQVPMHDEQRSGRR
jgi:hypothetical protein